MESILFLGPHYPKSMICAISLGWYACLIYIGKEQAINCAHEPTEAFFHIEDVYGNRKHGLCMNILVLSMDHNIIINRRIQDLCPDYFP